MTQQKPHHFNDTLSIKTEAYNIRLASEWLTSAFSSEKVPDAQIERLAVCLNEVLANIIEHGGPGARTSPISLEIDVNLMNHTNKASVTVRDAGIPFNPIEREQKKPAASLDDVKPGGLGLTMMRAFVDELRYDYIDNTVNQLSFSIYWEKSPEN